MGLERCETVLSSNEIGREVSSVLTPASCQIAWRYGYRNVDGTNPIRWEETWNSDRLPAAVQVELTLLGADGRRETLTRTYIAPDRDLTLWTPA